MPCFQGRAELGPRSSALNNERLYKCEKLPAIFTLETSPVITE